jgi:hypothetical protein
MTIPATQPTAQRPGVIEVRRDEQLLAIILKASFAEPGIHFLTTNDLSQQLACMRHPAGKKIIPHVHAWISTMRGASTLKATNCARAM